MASAFRYGGALRLDRNARLGIFRALMVKLADVEAGAADPQGYGMLTAHAGAGWPSTGCPVGFGMGDARAWSPVFASPTMRSHDRSSAER